MKRDYANHGRSTDEELGMAIKFCDSLMNSYHNQIEELSGSALKVVRDIKDKLLGAKKGNIKEYKILLNAVMGFVIPRYERTRVVKIVRMVDGQHILTCLSCRYFEKHGRACRHMYKILNRSPSVRDVKIRWHLGYSHHYGHNEEITEHYIHLRDCFNYPGIHLLDSEVKDIRSRHTVGEGENSLDFFQNSLNKLRLRGEDNY